MSILQYVFQQLYVMLLMYSIPRASTTVFCVTNCIQQTANNFAWLWNTHALPVLLSVVPKCIYISNFCR